MDRTEIRLVCPHCSLSTSVHVAGETPNCPRCGHPLQKIDAVGAEGGDVAGNEAVEVPSRIDDADDALIADLREAFASGVDLAHESEFPAPSRRDGRDSSAAFAHALGGAAFPGSRRLGDFEVLEEIGRGGMGVVYRARQLSLDRIVALKVLPEYARHGRLAVQRFRAEAQAAARIHHTNVVPVYAQGEQDGSFYYAMELVAGVGLDTVIRSRPELLSSSRLRSDSTDSRAHTPQPLPPVAPESESDSDEDVDRSTQVPWTRADYRHVAELMAEVADALDCAHRNGVIHRDVKPHNILLGPTNRLHLTDFGLARLTDAPHLTVDGEIMGTPAYLSPEQISGNIDAIDHRTDVYSLGVTLYELLTRQKPFSGATRQEVIASICSADPVEPRRLVAQIPVDLETICLRAIEKNPARRHASAADLAEDLRRFADGRPILSRRISRAEKVAKWVRRHKAATVAMVAAAAVVLLGVGLTWSMVASRHREAERLLGDAYEQLAFLDYRMGLLLEDDIDRAALLGADRRKIRLTRALADLGAGAPADAIPRLEALIQEDEADLRVWYMLAWAWWKDNQRGHSRALLERAEAMRVDGAPVTADAWFFRGLAIHYDDSNAAIESYREANARRAAEHAFYPQAVLHLARARNQQLYATRSLSAFDEAESNLRVLTEQEHYAAYPYYLLSITHRLAAEIYNGSLGTRDDSQVVTHYEEALAWAREGQDRYPADDRPITAEAECLESMGLFEEAIEARDRAIEVASVGCKRWEGYHYRWRLHYWLGDLDAALEDLSACAQYDPESPFYAHVYPALVHAELGDRSVALAHARAVAEENPDDAGALLWSATCLRLLGEADAAEALLVERAESVDFGAGLVGPQSEAWMQALVAYCQKGGSLGELDLMAAEGPAPWKLWGEAYFHAAALRLAAGDREGALEWFMHAYRSFDDEQRYTYHARLIAEKMREDRDWPPWIAVSLSAVPDTSTGPDLGEAAGTAH